MKKFTISVVCAALFFIGLGGLVEKTAAGFKSDEKALEIVRRARQAIGGETNINNVRSMTILGQATKTIVHEGNARAEQGTLEINFELPGKMTKSLKIGAGGDDAARLVDKKIDVIVMKKDGGDTLTLKSGDVSDAGAPGRKLIIKKSDGTTEEIVTRAGEPTIISKNGEASFVTGDMEGGETAAGGKKFVIRRHETGDAPDGVRQNELLKTTLSLLLTAPAGVDVSYTYAGEGQVDGSSCDIVEAASGGSTYKLYIDRSSSLPRMMTFQGVKPMIFTFHRKDAEQSGAAAEPKGDVKVFTRTAGPAETAEFQVKFSDFRNVGGLQLPHRWTQTIAGSADETIDVTSYDVNPAGIADKFKEMPAKVMIRTKS